jgi:hypothetical protein
MTGFPNVIAGLEHFPEHVYEAITSKDSFASRLLNSTPAQELIAYEKAHGADQLKAIETAGIAAYNADRAKGVDKATALVASIPAAFETGVAEVKSLSTMAMTLLLSTAAAEIG